MKPITEIIHELEYQKRLDEYNHHVQMLEIQRKKFYEENPDFPFKSMYINVIAPPQKITIKYI
jgi:hypothetical protein